MTLEARAELAFGEFSLDVDLTCRAGPLHVLVGPNGAGKTTLLRIVAGLERIDRGRVIINDVAVDDGEKTWVPPHRRDVGLVPQENHLLPQLTATDNVAFGLRRRGISAGESRRRANDWLAKLGIPDVARLRARELSGGQAKRVSIARALAPEPRLLIFDEPFASLDATSRRDVRRTLRDYHDAHDGVLMLVSHDPLDALAIGDRIVVLEAGRVVQDAEPDEIRVRPRSSYVADFVGMNLVRGTAHGTHVTVAEGVDIVCSESQPEGAGVICIVQPRAIALYDSEPHGSPRNTWPVTVTAIEDDGSRVRVALAGPVPLVAEITHDSVSEMQIVPGRRLYAAVKATEVSVFSD